MLTSFTQFFSPHNHFFVCDNQFFCSFHPFCFTERGDYVTLLADFSFPTQENAIVGSLFCSDSTFFFTNYRNRGHFFPKSGSKSSYAWVFWRKCSEKPSGGLRRGRKRGSRRGSREGPEGSGIGVRRGRKRGPRPPPPDPPKTTRNFDTFFLHVFPALFRHVRVSESPDQKNDKKRVRSDAPQEPSPVPSEGTLARGWRGFPTPMRVPLQGTQKVGSLRAPQGEVFDLPRGFGIPKPTLQRLRVHVNP
jgi:hypothetical protein